MQFWSGTAFMDSAEALAVASMLDDAGYDGMICADHLIYPRVLQSRYPTGAERPPWSPETAWPDSWILIGAMAVVTRRLRFSNAVYVAPARPLLEVAKQVATAAVISEDRVSLAVGIGWMRTTVRRVGRHGLRLGRRGRVRAEADGVAPRVRAAGRTVRDHAGVARAAVG